MKFSYQKLPIHQSANPSAPRISRPYLPVYLHGKVSSTPSPYYALLDSGADEVLMPEELAEIVGISDITTGRGPVKTIGVGGQTVDLYFHDLEVQLQGDSRRFATPVGFGKLGPIPLLGRSFFRHFRKVIFDEGNEGVEPRS